MLRKIIVLIISGLLVLALAGCGEPLSGNADGVTGTTNPTTSNAASTVSIIGQVVHLHDGIVTLWLVKEGDAASRTAKSDSPNSNNSPESNDTPSSSYSEAESDELYSAGNNSQYITTGEVKEINVKGSTDIILESGKSGALYNIEVGDILIVQMTGSTVESITVESSGND